MTGAADNKANRRISVSDEQPILIFLSSGMDESLGQFREAAVAAITPYKDFVRLWRFEDIPASERDAPDRFLRGVSRSDVVVFVSRADIKDGTAEEIIFAADSEIDILSFEIKTDRISQPLQTLRDAIRSISVIKVVPDDPNIFICELIGAIRDYLLRRIRNPDVALNRAQKLSRMLKESGARLEHAWTALGVGEAVARGFVGDSSIGAPPDEPFDDPFVAIVGPVGSGKSTTLERIFQTAIRRAQSDIMAPIPVRIEASGINRPFEEEVRTRAKGLGALDVNGATIVIDGIDNISASEALDLLRQIRNSIDNYDMRVYAAMRQCIAAVSGCVAPQRPLSKEEVTEILRRITGRLVPYETAVGDIPESAAEAVKWPLFAVMLALRIASHRYPSATSRSEFLEQMVSTASRTTLERGPAEEHLQRLARALVDRATETVPWREIGSVTDLSILREHSIVVGDSQTIGFVHRFFADFFAARWLRSAPREDLRKILQSPALADRWRDALALAAQLLDDDDAFSLINEMAKAQPHVAALAVKDSYRERTGGKDAAATAIAMRDAMSAFGESMHKVSKVDDAGEALPLLFEDIGHNRARWGWFDRFLEEIHLDKIERTVPAGRFPYRINRYVSRIVEQEYRLDRFWPYAMVKEWLVRDIDRRLRQKDFPVVSPTYDAELRWNAMKTIIGRHNSYNQEPIRLEEVARRTARFGSRIVQFTNGSQVDVTALNGFLSAEQERGAAVARAPYPVGSGPSDTGMIADRYNTEELHARVHYAFSGAMNIYQEIVRTWLPGLSSFLVGEALAPICCIVHLWKASGFDVVDYVMFPADGPTDNRLALVSTEPAAQFHNAGEYDELIRTRRPSMAGRFNAPMSHMSLLDSGILGNWPARDLALAWLASDLRAIEWATFRQ